MILFEQVPMFMSLLKVYGTYTFSLTTFRMTDIICLSRQLVRATITLSSFCSKLNKIQKFFCLFHYLGIPENLTMLRL